MPQRKKEMDSIDPRQMIRLEQELADLKERYEPKARRSLFVKAGDFLASHSGPSKPVSRKNYIRLAVCCGWFCGAHRFYSGHPIVGLLYLFFFWTGIPFAMTLVDLMIALPMKADDSGYILL